MATADLGFFFAPRSIAVAGASNKPGKMGNLFAQRLAAAFRGRLLAINPAEREVAGIPACASLAELPEPVDLLIALVPAARLLELVESCPAGRVRYLLAVPSGFGEVAGEGRRLEARLAAAARRRGMRMVGPNCVGMLNCSLGLNASMMPVIPPGGRGLSCVTESGGFGMALSMYALDHGLAVAKFSDLGNMVDLQVDEVLRYLATDSETAVVGLYLESLRNPPAFAEALAELARRKPVILTPVGRSSAGRRASFAHLGMTRGLADVMAELPPGVLRAETGADLLDAAKMLLWQPRAAGRRIAVVTGTGGIGAELTDLALDHGLEVPEFSARLQATLGRHLPSYAGVRNPVDLTPIWWDYPKLYPAVLRDIARSGEVDQIVVSITDVPTTLPDLAEALAGMEPSPVPLCVYWGARDQDVDKMHKIQAARIPCYRATRDAVRAAAAAAPSRAVREFGRQESSPCAAKTSAA